MSETSECRLCLKTSKRLHSLNDLKNGVPYWLMIQSISNIKMTGTDEKACVSCCRRLVEAYNFKLLIESTDTSLRKTNTSNRIMFNNIEDIKVKIEIPDDRPTQESILDNIEIDAEQFNYHDTLVRRVAEADRKSLSVVEFLNSFKEESDNEDYAEYTHQDADYAPVDYKIHTSDDDENKDGHLLAPLSVKKTRNKEYRPIKPNSDDNEDEDGHLLTPLSIRKTRNKEYKPIKPKVVKKPKKTRNYDDYDEDYLPKQSKKKNIANRQECKKGKGRPRHGIALAVPIKPQVMDNIRLSISKELKMTIRTKQKEICYHCGKQCTSLKAHLLTHSGEYKFKCDKCSKAFRCVNSLRTHKQRHESRTIKCELCVASFTNRSAYMSHKRHHTSEKNFICELCSKAFKLKYQLRKHKRHMHNIGVAEHKCETCAKVCKTRDLLRHHIRVHTRERPYNCEICSQPYSYKHDFNRHCLKKHGVLFKRRSVYVMNEEVLVKERALMRNLMLRINEVGDDLPENPFDGPQGYLAYQQMMKFLESQQLPVELQL